LSAGSPIPALALCALLAAPGAAAQEPAAAARELTLAEALRRALFANPALGRARAEIDAAQAQRRGALALILPRLTASGSLLRNSTEVTFGTDEDRRVLLPITDWNARLVLQQPVFAGLREQRAYQQAREGVRAAEQGLVAAQDRVLLRTATDYLGVVQGELLLEVERRALALARERLAQAQSVYEAGEATRVDVLRAESDVKAAERRVTLAVRQREVAAGQLRVDLDLDGEVAVREPAAELPPRPDEAGLMERAERARGDLQQARSNVHIAVLEVAKQKGAYLPVLTADAGWIWQKTTFPTDRYGFAALRVSVPLWQSGEIGARVATARARARQAELQLAEARRQVREDVRRALLDVQTAELDLALAEEQLAASEAEYQQVFELYRGQEATSLDVQASEAGLSAARRAVVNGRLARVLAELLAWFAAGDMRSALVEEVQP
jgi:outer membrane protein TolC